MLAVAGHTFEIRPSAEIGFDAVVTSGSAVPVGTRVGYGFTAEQAEEAVRANMPRRLAVAAPAAPAPAAPTPVPTETKRPVEAVKESPMSPTEKKIHDTYGAEALATWQHVRRTLGADAADTYERSLASAATRPAARRDPANPRVSDMDPAMARAMGLIDTPLVQNSESVHYPAVAFAERTAAR